MDINLPTVSVIIPSYNQASYVKETIQSVLDQDFRDYEIILVDDGSTDNTQQVLTQFGDKIRNIWQENKGLSGARNTGITNAVGDFIALLDSDDTWLPDFLSTTLAWLTARPELGAVHTGFYFIDEQGNRLSQISSETVPDNQMYDRLLDGEFFVPAAVLTRRECFDQVGLFDENFLGSEDWDMWLRVSQKYPFAGIPVPLVNYRMHASNMSKDPDFMLRYQLMVAKKHFGSPDGSPEDWPPERQRAYAAVYRYASQGFYFHGDIKKGQHYLRLALEANPSLSDSLDLFFELSCTDQPLGWRGDFEKHDLERNSEILLSSLENIFADSTLSYRLLNNKRTAFANAYFALGLHAYGSNQLGLSRRYLLRAIKSQPFIRRQKQLLFTLSKSMLGKRWLHTLKSGLIRRKY